MTKSKVTEIKSMPGTKKKAVDKAFVVMAPAPAPGDVPHFAALGGFSDWVQDPQQAWKFPDKRTATAHARRLRMLVLADLTVLTVTEAERRAVEALMVLPDYKVLT